VVSLDGRGGKTPTMASLLSEQSVIVAALQSGFGVDFKAMLDQQLGHTWHIRWFPRKYVMVSPKEANEHTFLFVAQAASNQSSLG
jgi:galactose-1-phosphate uridylyltransferase